MINLVTFGRSIDLSVNELYTVLNDGVGRDDASGPLYSKALYYPKELNRASNVTKQGYNLSGLQL